MGFERLVRVLQNKQSNYDTDIFTGTIKAISGITGKKYGGTENDKADIAFRVISDHIRAICFTIADGQLPDEVYAAAAEELNPAEIASVEKQIDAEKARIRLLQAEVAHLEQPARIETLSTTHLGMAPLQAKHETTIDKLSEIAIGKQKP